MFSDVNVPQSSVATYARSGGIFSNQFTANLLRNPSVENICKSVKTLQSYGHEFGVYWIGRAEQNGRTEQNIKIDG